LDGRRYEAAAEARDTANIHAGNANQCWEYGIADLRHFAEWLSTTSPSVFIQDHYSWVIPTIQSIHIVGIGVLLGSVLMVDLRILGWAGTDQTLRQTLSRFAPWVTGALCLQLATGMLMVIGEPVRELVTFSFWLKMLLVAVSTIIAVIFQIAVRHHEQQWQETLVNRRSIKWLAVLTFLIWVCIIILGRLIAYDHVWGSWSPARRA
jgi:putative copper export protein